MATKAPTHPDAISDESFRRLFLAVKECPETAQELEEKTHRADEQKRAERKKIELNT